MPKRILVVATSDIHLQVFHLPYFEMLKSQGHHLDAAVEVRGNGQVAGIEKLYNLPFKRTLFTTKLLVAYKQLKQIINEGNYDIIHCHTPIPAALTRLAAKQARAKGTVVMYTAHGFHFYKGAPVSYWLTYYLAEKYLSRFTDAIVTINQEDYQLAKTKFKANHTFYIPGIGVDTNRFKPVDNADKQLLRQQLGLPEDAFTLFYAANFIHRKNHRFVIESLVALKERIPNLKLLLAGSGKLLIEMQELATVLCLQDTVHFLGFRSDINELLAIADVSISASRQEGLGLALAEAMINGVPVVATVDRGHKELIVHGENGFLYGQGNQQEFIAAIMKLYQSDELSKTFANRALVHIQKFFIENSLREMNKIYSKFLNSNVA
ncbi:glycosyltransferase family 4 protein [Pedobacter sp. SL55]|uniref:glycosyltransferase family 4 protein n=1 Tax=Pedobacter sp. SL55 TaxID=2995161 RepID=UPI00226F5719|nr:glycosyltransferase family 4 protein [Pedobacter sp. SL55]WAC40201.1 glycosyltransferase family 4 protein [Pedobacter sp. SL55]